MTGYKSRRERRRVGGAAEKSHHGMAIIIAVTPKKKKKVGGWVEGEKARSHLGRRARGGRTKRADGGETDGAKESLLSQSALGGSDYPNINLADAERDEMNRAADDAERSDRQTYRGKLHNGITSSAPEVAAQQVLRRHLGDANVGPMSNPQANPMARLSAAQARQRQDEETPGYRRGGHIDFHGNRVEYPDGHEEVHRQRQNRDQPIDQVMSYRKGGEIERTPSGGVKASARHKAEARGETMKDGSFPIRNAADLKNAKHDVGRAKNPEAARKWIKKRAHELGEPPLGG